MRTTTAGNRRRRRWPPGPRGTGALQPRGSRRTTPAGDHLGELPAAAGPHPDRHLGVLQPPAMATRSSGCCSRGRWPPGPRGAAAAGDGRQVLGGRRSGCGPPPRGAAAAGDGRQVLGSRRSGCGPPRPRGSRRTTPAGGGDGHQVLGAPGRCSRGDRGARRRPAITSGSCRRPPVRIRTATSGCCSRRRWPPGPRGTGALPQRGSRRTTPAGGGDGHQVLGAPGRCSRGDRGARRRPAITSGSCRRPPVRIRTATSGCCSRGRCWTAAGIEAHAADRRGAAAAGDGHQGAAGGGGAAGPDADRHGRGDRGARRRPAGRCNRGGRPPGRCRRGRCPPGSCRRGDRGARRRPAITSESCRAGPGRRIEVHDVDGGELPATADDGHQVLGSRRSGCGPPRRGTAAAGDGHQVLGAPGRCRRPPVRIRSATSGCCSRGRWPPGPREPPVRMRTASAGSCSRGRCWTAAGIEAHDADRRGAATAGDGHRGAAAAGDAHQGAAAAGIEAHDAGRRSPRRAAGGRRSASGPPPRGAAAAGDGRQEAAAAGIEAHDAGRRSPRGAAGGGDGHQGLGAARALLGRQGAAGPPVRMRTSSGSSLGAGIAGPASRRRRSFRWPFLGRWWLLAGW